MYKKFHPQVPRSYGDRFGDSFGDESALHSGDAGHGDCGAVVGVETFCFHHAGGGNAVSTFAFHRLGLSCSRGAFSGCGKQPNASVG